MPCSTTRLVSSHLALVASLLLALASVRVAAAQVPQTVDYQGVLKNGGTPVEDPGATLTFRLYDAATGGSVLWIETQTGVVIADGVFGVQLGASTSLDGVDFGSPLWLSVAVGDASAPELAPRTELAAVPYALGLRVPFTATGSTPLDTPLLGLTQTGEDNGARLIVDNPSSTRAALYAETNGGSNAIVAKTTGTGGAASLQISNPSSTFSALFARTDGQGHAVLGRTTGTGSGGRFEVQNPENTSAALYAESNAPEGYAGLFVGQVAVVPAPGVTTGAPLVVEGTIESLEGGIKFPDGTVQTSAAAAVDNVWQLGGNAGTTPGTNFLGTTDAQPLEVKVGAQRVMRYEPPSDASTEGPNVLGGWSGNSIPSGVVGATIAGGGLPDFSGVAQPNEVGSNYGVVGGGWGNAAGGAYATVSGGGENRADGIAAAIGGGQANAAAGLKASVGGGSENSAGGSYSTVGGGRSNQALASYATIAGGGEWDPGDPTTANRVYDEYGTIGGGAGNQAGFDDADPTSHTYSTVGGGNVNMASGSRATVGGGHGNTASGGSATVGGGFRNTASGHDATVGGGETNTASGGWATVGGGNTNIANASEATVGGGISNTASGNDATVGGGNTNIASGSWATVGGGISNIASGNDATVPGGFSNRADGVSSFAAGRDAHADHDRSFVWNDAQVHAPLATTGPNQFLVSATGGVIIEGIVRPGSDAFYSLGTSGKRWTSVWATDGTINTSDRRAKQDIDPLAYGLREVLRLHPVRYRWKDRPEAGPRLGLIAQEVEAVLPEVVRRPKAGKEGLLGMSYAELVPVLVRALQEQQAEIETLKAQTDRLDRLEAQVAALQAALEQ